MSWSISRINPRFVIEGELHAMATQRRAAIPVSEIGPELADLSARRDDIIAATDFLFRVFKHVTQSAQWFAMTTCAKNKDLKRGKRI
ncbi:MAG TPA: CcdB family protein [Pararhizobium sp.]|uniref:CcdB family protein n=1 Tax=Pararhizobium sp. TaxID=1977563 RepID=UPI002BCE2250|nr:CcdB family protein [Pararhizobium sp.]HTO30775.1 CcdB family protein [Pararhizobium sp.]